MAASVDFTISFDTRTREEARDNVLDALRTVLTPDEELVGQTPHSDYEHLRFIAAA